MKNTGLDKILGRVEDLDSVNLGILVKRLARERKMQETVFNTIQDGILVMDADEIVQYANHAALSLIGLKKKDIGVERLRKVVPGLAKSMDRGKGSGNRRNTQVSSREVKLSYPESRVIRLYTVPINAQVGHGEGGYVVVLSDITEDKVSVKEQVESERLDSIMLLVAGVAHELGNPLNSLTIHLQLIERKLKKLKDRNDRTRLRESLEICQGEVQHLDQIITHFLEAMRPQKPELQKLDLAELIEEVLRVQEPELTKLSLGLKVRVTDGLPCILGDFGQIKQVLFNLIKNAIEAMEPGDELSILARSDDEFVYVQLADTGSGISEEDLSKIFQAYYTTKDAGHGLGMTIVERIMREHGGHINIDSTENVGTAITLQFPQQHRRVRLLN